MNNAVIESDGSDASVGQDEPVPAKLDVLHIDVASLTSYKGVRTVIEPLAGSPPTDCPIWVDHTASDVDVRGAFPFSLRYVSNKERGFVVPLTGQGEIRKAIWKSSKRSFHLSATKSHRHLPRVDILQSKCQKATSLQWLSSSK